MLPWLVLACQATEPTQPDVVLISLDTVRADALSSYGNPRPTTPHLDGLAARGTRFASAYAPAPSTLSSHSTVFTGLDPHGTQIVRNGWPLRPEVETLAERLGASGWDTAAVIGSSALARPMGVDQGFVRWDEEFSIARRQRHEATATEVTDRALRQLGERAAGKPLFLFVHYYDAHSPYDAPEPYRNRWSAEGMAGRYEGKQGALKELAAQIRAGIHDPAELKHVVDRYLGEVSYVDAELGRLLAGLRPGSIVVVFGDHGDMFGEVPDRPFGHGADLDPAVSHVPLLVVAPGRAPSVEERPVGLQDVPATVLDLLGLGQSFGEGRTLFDPAERHRFMEATQPEPAAGQPGWNNLRTERAVLGGGQLLLRAPWLGTEETLDARTRSPTTPDPALGRLLDGWDAAAPPRRDVEMGDATREGLKALGYLE